MDKYTISQIASLAQINKETIRYYEREHLLPVPERDERGYRCYDGNDLKQIHFIKSAQGLGFSLKEITAILSLQETSESVCENVQNTVTAKLKIVKDKISQLKKIERALKSLKNSCNPDDKQCAIIKTLEDEKFF